MLEKKFGIAIAAALMLTSTQIVMAQSQLQTPDGHQTIAPSQMPQQPSVGEEFTTPGNINQKTLPNNNIDQPGIPGVQMKTQPHTGQPGFLPNSTNPGENNPSKFNKTTRASQAPITAPGAAPQAGSLVFPQGYSSTTRVGPIQPVPMWERGILAAFLLLNLLVTSIVAVSLFRAKEEHDEEYQGGKPINEGYVEPLATHRVNKVA